MSSLLGVVLVNRLALTIATRKPKGDDLQSRMMATAMKIMRT